MDFEKALLLLKALDDNKVEYILIGALGMTVHGIVRATQDVDLFIRPLEDNIKSLREALSCLFPDDSSIAEITIKDLAGEYPAIQYNSPDGSLQVDILSKLGDAFSFEDLKFEEKHYEGIRVLVATPETLYRMKKDTVRLQDRADAETIKELFNLKDE
jgi:hypothetical protein